MRVIRQEFIYGYSLKAILMLFNLQRQKLLVSLALSYLYNSNSATVQIQRENRKIKP